MQTLRDGVRARHTEHSDFEPPQVWPANAVVEAKTLGAGADRRTALTHLLCMLRSFACAAGSVMPNLS